MSLVFKGIIAVLKAINEGKDIALANKESLVVGGDIVIKKAREKGVKIIDCTCPFVRDIQKIVEKHYNEGYTIAIIGNADHPEIKGINGWCNNSAIITESSEVLSSIEFDKLCVVVQTTYFI